MYRNAKLAVLMSALLTGAACHNKALPPSPAAPAAQPPATQPTSTQDNNTAAQDPTPANPTPPPHRPRPTPPQTPPAAPAQPEYRLGQSLTPEEQRANSALIERHLRHATQALASIGNRALTQQQKSLVPQIQGFIAQAQQMRTTDPVGARSLAEKADVLASDLVAGLR
jgi:hypothetical protein